MTREEAISAMGFLKESVFTSYAEEALDMAISALREQEEYESLKNSYHQLQDIFDSTYASNMAMGKALREQPRWISVEERLPEKYKFVLCHKDGKIRIGYYIGAEYVKGVAAFADYSHTHSFGVTHWMPLPSTEGLE